MNCAGIRLDRVVELILGHHMHIKRCIHLSRCGHSQAEMIQYGRIDGDVGSVADAALILIGGGY